MSTKHIKVRNHLKAYAPCIWEIVPDDLKHIEKLDKFKREIKKWQPVECPCRLCKHYESGVGFVNITE